MRGCLNNYEKSTVTQGMNDPKAKQYQRREREEREIEIERVSQRDLKQNLLFSLRSFQLAFSLHY